MKIRIKKRMALWVSVILFPVASLAADYYWMDGDTRRPLKMAPHLAAYFKNTPHQLTQAERSRVVSIQEEKGLTTIYRLDSSLSAAEEVALFTESVSLSPIFIGGGGAFKALPGGVLVIFKKDIEPASIAEFFQRDVFNGVAAEPLGWHPRGYMVDTEPGLASLDLANLIAGEKDLVNIASPNWWDGNISPR